MVATPPGSPPKRDFHNRAPTSADTGLPRELWIQNSSGVITFWEYDGAWTSKTNWTTAGAVVTQPLLNAGNSVPASGLGVSGSWAFSTNAEGSTTTIYSKDGTGWSVFTILTGGAQGIQGEKGDPSTVPGERGIPGEDSTVPGPKGNASIVPGPVGPQGPISTTPGPIGPTGPPGADSIVPGPTGPPSTIPGPQGIPGTTANKGDPGTPGSVIYNGNGAPTTSTGIEGDYYLDRQTDNLYHWGVSGWTVIGSFRGHQGVAGQSTQIFIEDRPPIDSDTALEGDIWLDQSNDYEMYKQESSAWVSKGRLKGEQGIQGVPGESSVVPGPTGPPSTTPGPQGERGEDSTVPGPRGEQGEPSVVPGPQGLPGRDGTGTDILPIEYSYKALTENATVAHLDFEVGGVDVPATKVIFLATEHDATLNDLQDKIIIGWATTSQSYDEARIAGQYSQIIGHTITTGIVNSVLENGAYTLSRFRVSDDQLFIENPVPGKLLWLSYSVSRNEIVLTLASGFVIQEFGYIPASLDSDFDMSGDASFTAVSNVVSLRLHSANDHFAHYIGQYNKTTNYPASLGLALYVKNTFYRYDPDALWLQGQDIPLSASIFFRITPVVSHVDIDPTNKGPNAIASRRELDGKVSKTTVQKFCFYARLEGVWAINSIENFAGVNVNIRIQNITDRIGIASSLPVELSGQLGNAVSSSGVNVPIGYLIFKVNHNSPLNDETANLQLAWGEEAVIANYQFNNIPVVAGALLTADAYAAVGFTVSHNLYFYSKKVVDTPVDIAVTETETAIIWNAVSINNPNLVHLIGSFVKTPAPTSLYKPLEFSIGDIIAQDYLQKLDATERDPVSYYRFTRFNSSTAQRYLFSTETSYEPSKIHRIGVDLVFYIAKTSGGTSVVRTLDKKMSLSRYDECKVLYDQGTHTTTFPKFEDTFSILFVTSNSAYFTHELFNVGDGYGGDSSNVFTIRGKWIYDINAGVERIRGMFLTGTNNSLPTLASSTHLEMRFAAYSKVVGGLD